MINEEQGVGITHSEIYRAAISTVDDATTNPTSPPHREITAWKDLSPVVSECLQSHVNLLSIPEQEWDVPRDSERQ